MKNFSVGEDEAKERWFGYSRRGATDEDGVYAPIAFAGCKGPFVVRRGMGESRDGG